MEYLKKLEAVALRRGVPQSAVDKIEVLGHKIGDVAILLLHDGEEATTKFIEAEWLKIATMIANPGA